MDHVNSSVSVGRCFLLLSLVLKEWLTAPREGAEPTFAFRLPRQTRGAYPDGKMQQLSVCHFPGWESTSRAAPVWFLFSWQGFSCCWPQTGSSCSQRNPRLRGSPWHVPKQGMDGQLCWEINALNALKKGQTQHWKANWAQQNGDKGKFCEVDKRTLERN